MNILKSTTSMDIVLQLVNGWREYSQAALALAQRLERDSFSLAVVYEVPSTRDRPSSSTRTVVDEPKHLLNVSQEPEGTSSGCNRRSHRLSSIESPLYDLQTPFSCGNNNSIES